MAHSSVTIIKEADGTVDAEYLALAVKINPSCSGVAIAFGEDEPMEVATNRATADIEKVMELQKEHKDKRIFFSFGSHPEGFPDDEMQPWTLLKSATEDLVVAFVDGDFPGFEKNDSYSSAFHFAQEFLIPEVSSMYLEVEGDMDTFISKLNASEFKKKIEAEAKPRGTVTILMYDGRAVTHQKNDLFGDFSEFYTSNDYGWNEETEAVAKGPVVVEKKKSKISIGKEPEPTPVVKPNGKTNDLPPGVHKVSEKPVDKVMQSCPRTITKWADVRQWYKTNAGFVPGDYKKYPTVPIAPSLTAPLPTPAPKETPHVPASPPTPKPDTLPVSDPKPKAPLASTVSEFFHIIPPEEAKKFHKDFAPRDDIKAVLDGDGHPIISAQNLQSQEKRWATFCEQTKIKDLLEVAAWQDPAIWLLIKEHPRYAFKLIKDLVRAYAISKVHGKQEETKPTPKGAVTVPERKRA